MRFVCAQLKMLVIESMQLLQRIKRGLELDKNSSTMLMSPFFLPHRHIPLVSYIPYT